MLRTFLVAAAFTMVAWVTPRAGMPIPSQEVPGRYDLVSAGEAHPWQLPLAGDGHNGCFKGNVRGVHWSANGKFLVTELSSESGMGLCFYDLRGFSFADVGVGKAPRIVEMRPLTTAGKSSRFSPGVRAPGASTSGGISEYEFAWAVSDVRGDSPAMAFSVTASSSGLRSKGGRVFGVPPVPLADETWSFGSLDGQPEEHNVEDTSYYQPSWVVQAGGKKDEFGIVMVSNVKLGCGKEHLIYFPKVEKSPLQSMVPFVVTQPCSVAADDPFFNTGDRYPAVSPNIEDDRVAFIRATPGHLSQVCVATGLRAMDTQDHTKCWFSQAEDVPVNRFQPTWSPDGRYLLYYVTVGEPGAGLSKTHIEVLDFKLPVPKPRVILRGIRPNAAQAASIVRFDESGRSYAIAILEEGDSVVAVSLDGKVKTPITLQLQNLVAVSGVGKWGTLLLGVVAQGYEKSGDLKTDKVFITQVEVAGW